MKELFYVVEIFKYWASFLDKLWYYFYVHGKKIQLLALGIDGE